MSEVFIINTRKDLSDFLQALPGNPHVYYAPPNSTKIKYPAIIYKRSNIRAENADNRPYNIYHMYDVTVIDTDLDSKIVEELARTPNCRHSRHFEKGNLSHDIFSIYY